jgi:hypothetical protein
MAGKQKKAGKSRKKTEKNEAIDKPASFVDRLWV